MNDIAIISTSANPLHIGHIAIANWAKNHNYDIIFDISITNANKGTISEEDILKRNIQAISLGYNVVNLKSPLFCDKYYELLDMLPNRNFVFCVGYDVILNIDNPYYYKSKSVDITQEEQRDISLMPTKFIVFPRNGYDLSILSPVLRERCVLADNYVGINISSTELRQHGLKSHGY